MGASDGGWWSINALTPHQFQRDDLLLGLLAAVSSCFFMTLGTSSTGGGLKYLYGGLVLVNISVMTCVVS